MATEYFAVAVEGIKGIGDLDKLDDRIFKAARLAVNATARRAVPAAARSMEQQINFPRGYLTGQNGRLGIAKFATGDSLEALVRGRDRPTSLARFAVGGAQVGKKGGVTVSVDPGVAKRMPSAFAIRLRNGNIGLAYRSKDGKPPSVGAKKISENLYLLYGPSVDQVFNKTREIIAGDMEDFMNREFTRLLDLNL